MMPKTKSSTKAKAPAKAAAVKVKTAPAAAHTSPARARTYKDIFSRRLTADLSLGAMFAELTGSFILTAVILSTSNDRSGGLNAVIIALAFIFLTIAFNRISGGHINPVVTVALAATRKIGLIRAGGYIVAQVLGAMLALVVIAQFLATSPTTQQLDPMTGQAVTAPKPQTFKLPALEGDWRPFLAEGLGGLIVGFGVAAAYFNRQDGFKKGYLIGGAILLGMLLSIVGSSAVLNPAAALTLDAYKFDNLWTIAVYAIAPFAGAAAGAWMFLLMQRDAESSEV